MHLDGYNLLPYFKGEAKESPRKEFLYWNDDGKLVALRYNRWKLVFAEQRGHGFDVWQEPFVDCACRSSSTCAPTRSSGRATNRSATRRWRIERVFLLVPAQAYVANWLASFKEFPPRRSPRASASTR